MFCENSAEVQCLNSQKSYPLFTPHSNISLVSLKSCNPEDFNFCLLYKLTLSVILPMKVLLDRIDLKWCVYLNQLEDCVSHCFLGTNSWFKIS